MPTIAEVREKFPQYNDMSDADLAGALHQKFYADMPKTEFDSLIGLPPERGAGVKAGRMADFAAQGFIDRGAELVTAPADLVWAGVEALTGWKPPGGTAADKLKGAIRSGAQAMNDATAPYLPDMGRNAPETQGERNAMAGGAGAADALSVVLPGAALARGARAGSTLQRVGQAAAQQPVVQMASGAAGGAVTEATDSPWLGLAASLAVPSGGALGQRVISPVRNQLTPEARRLAGVARQEGIPLTTAQATGSRPLQSLESVFKTLPTTATTAKRTEQAQADAFTRAALSRAGISGDSADPAVLAAAQQRLSAEFTRLSAATTVRYDQRFANDVQAVIRQYANRLDAQRRPLFENFVNDIAGFGTQMPGTTYQTVRSDLGRMAKNSRQNDPTYAQALKGLQRALDDVAERSVPTRMKDDWKRARADYSALKSIEKAMANTTFAAGSGSVPPTAFANAVKQQYGPGYARGLGEMNDLSRVGTQFLRDPIPNSGTPERTFWQNAMTNPLTLLGGGTAAAFDPVATAIGVATPLAVPWAAQKLYNAPWMRRYMRNQIATGGPQLTAGLLGSIGIANAPGRRDDEPGLLGP